VLSTTQISGVLGYQPVVSPEIAFINTAKIYMQLLSKDTVALQD
jgi:hypothetical protein